MRLAVTMLAAVLAASTLPALAAQPSKAAPATTPVILHTSMGDIRIALETERAPVTSQNFLKYVDSGRYDGATFYRAIRSPDGSEGLVQGGLNNGNRQSFAPIAHESTVDTGLSHVDGAISMARQKPGTARGEFFIIVGKQVTYDGVPDGGDPGFAVFGRVVSGMPIVRKIMRQPRSKEARTESMKGEMLVQPVTIITAKRVTPAP